MDRLRITGQRYHCHAGAPARGVLTGAETHAVTVKVAGSKREADESFTVRGRLVSPTVALRAALRED